MMNFSVITSLVHTNHKCNRVTMIVVPILVLDLMNCLLISSFKWEGDTTSLSCIEMEIPVFDTCWFLI